MTKWREQAIKNINQFYLWNSSNLLGHIGSTAGMGSLRQGYFRKRNVFFSICFSKTEKLHL